MWGEGPACVHAFYVGVCVWCTCVCVRSAAELEEAVRQSRAQLEELRSHVQLAAQVRQSVRVR